MPDDVATILAAMDAQAAEFSFPGFNNMNYESVDSRLHAYSDGERWALVVEELVDWQAADGMNTLAFVMGNCLPIPSGLGPSIVPIEPSLVDPDEGLPETLAIRGATITVDRDRVVARAHEIGMDDSFALLVELDEAHRDALFRTEEELRELVPAHLPEVLRLEEWCHPDVYGGPKPSESEAFQQIAEVLATGDASRYAPTEAPNSRDWAFWLASR